MKKILILTLADLKKYPRAVRQINLLKDKYEIYTVGIYPNGNENQFYEIIKLSMLEKLIRFPYLKLNLFDSFYWDKNKINLLKRLSDVKFDLIIAHSIKTLPLAIKISNKSKIIFDEHEYAIKEYEERFVWRFLFKDYLYYLIKKNINRVDRIITVSQGISDEYFSEFKVNTDVIINASEYFDLLPQPIQNNKIKLIYHGSASPGRKIELMIEMMKFLNKNYTLDLMLVKGRGFESYFKKLIKRASEFSNVKIISPVPFDEIEKFSNNYDIGVFLVPPTNFSLRHTLPNKFFQFIQSRLAIAIGPSPDMSKFVSEYDLGVIADYFTPREMAKRIANLSAEQIMKYKMNAHKYAHKLSFENEGQRLSTIIDNLLHKSFTP